MTSYHVLYFAVCERHHIRAVEPSATELAVGLFSFKEEAIKSNLLPSDVCVIEMILYFIIFAEVENISETVRD
jgi:hypothetical protein